MDDYKPRDQHRGNPERHLGQTHFEKSEVENAAKALDNGPNFGTPGAPPDIEPEVEEKLDEAYEDIDREQGVPRAG